MDRRTYLERCVAVGAAVGLAGCTERTLEAAKEQPPWVDPLVDLEEIDLPVSDEFDEVVDGIEQAAAETFAEPAELESYLDEAGLSVEALEEIEEAGETILELEYVAEDGIEEGNAHSLGLVAGGYAALVRGGYDGDELSASVLEPDGATFGEFEVLTSWAEEYDAGETSAAVYAGDVVHTLEST